MFLCFPFFFKTARFHNSLRRLIKSHDSPSPPLIDGCLSVVGSSASTPTANTTNCSRRRRRRRASPQFAPRPFDSPPTKCIFCCLCHQTLAPGLTVELLFGLLVWQCAVRVAGALTGNTDRKERFSKKVCGKLAEHQAAERQSSVLDIFVS